MKISLAEKATRVWYAIGVIILACLIFSFLWHFKDIVVLIILCTLCSYLLSPVVSFFMNPIKIRIRDSFSLAGKEFKMPWHEVVIETKKGFSRPVSISLTFLIIGMVLFFSFMSIVPVATSELNNFQAHREEYIKHVSDFKEKTVEFIKKYAPDAVKASIDKKSEDFDFISYVNIDSILNGLVAIKGVMSSLAHIILMPILTFYMLLDYDIFIQAIMALVPSAQKKEVAALLGEVDTMLKKYILGQLLVCLIIAVTVSLAMLAMGLPYAVLIGVFAGAVDVIPYVGVIAGMIPSVIFALFKSPIYALFVIVVLYLIHWTEGHIIIPNIMGHSINIPPLAIIFALLAGFRLMGIVGMLLAVPIVAVIRVVIEFYVRKRDLKEAKIEE